MNHHDVIVVCAAKAGEHVPLKPDDGAEAQKRSV